ncbi:hypothetical protein BWQ96_03612 [Gracilariopsis chorda]|uniref:Uncharacterized protein n=1 Tax=Gracilariopsis chorda TaxID=448386 RepID=A0A2V3IX38_9FLOR|nr:hypothetical protein BWQ96_03612 [Gracilariopsis chorda]|eukprot:PXF46623.1 hypothetical protein BWQ96_03612 [Gracilariopsis chorda]
MLRRKPTLIEVDQADIDELDQLRNQAREKFEQETQGKGSRAETLTELSARENAVQGMSLRDRLGFVLGNTKEEK